MSLFTIDKTLTVGISIKNNLPALKLCLTSVLTGVILPSHIQLRIESDMPEFDDFYFAQLAALARQAGVNFELHFCKSESIFATRQWQVENCKTKYLLFLDDDVIINHDTVCQLMAAVTHANAYDKQRPGAVAGEENWIYIQGCKCDLNNRRGYGNFSLAEQNAETAYTTKNFNNFYNPDSFKELVPMMQLMNNDPRADPGCLLVNLHTFKRNKISFIRAETFTNAGGEDVIFALECAKLKLVRWFAPKVLAFHLEKPVSRMSNFAYYKGYVMRTAEKLGLPTDEFEKLLPWEPVYTFHPQKP